MIEKTRLPEKVFQSAPADFGVSSNMDRRCKSCACHLEIKNPVDPKQSQSVCRRNPPGLMTTMNPITKQADIGISFSPTMPELVCFDGWRAIDTPPGKSEGIMPAHLMMAMEKAAKIL